MTLREAYEFGSKCKPIIYDGIKYQRILRCGYTFTEKGEAIPFCELKSKEDRSITVAKCEACEVCET